jgi:hypothetical protein
MAMEGGRSRGLLYQTPDETGTNQKHRADLLESNAIQQLRQMSGRFCQLRFRAR